MSRFLQARFQTMEAYTPGEQPRDMEYIKLNTNESPYPPAPSVRALLDGEQAALLRLYSDPTCDTLRRKLAALYGLEPENISLGNGSDELLNFAFLAFGGGGVAYPDISYGFYPVYARLHGLDALSIPLEADYSLDPGKYHGLNRMIVIANPNAPTGLWLTVAQIEGIVQTNPDRVVLIDEAYVDFGGESCYPLIKKYDNLLVVRTFSKSRCLAGGRLGYAMGSPALIVDLEKLRYSTNPYNINRLTQLLGAATVDADSYYMEKCAQIAATREKTAEDLRSLGLSVLPSRTNFLFVHAGALGGERLYLALKARGILVRYFSAPRTRDYVRVTIGTPEQMAAFLAAVKEILNHE